MDDPNITMEDYIRLEEEKALRRGTVYNWETAKYGKIWYDEDVHDLRSVKTEFPAIVFNDALTSEVTPSCGPSVSPLNDNEIDFRISFDESDDEDYTVVYDENSFSYKIISVNNLKTDSENDNDQVNMPEEPSERNDNVVIMESLVKKKQKGAILELKRRHLKNTIFCTYTPYPAMKIRRISASSAQETRNDQFPIRRIHYNQYAVCTAVHQSKIRI
ncbi:hypothetical protein Tco_1370183 [Tanacetum coccineum]